jgi:hypothetical protein
MATLSEWEKLRLEPPGSGGQSTVYLARQPETKIVRDKSFEAIKSWSGQDRIDSEGAGVKLCGKSAADLRRVGA